MQITPIKSKKDYEAALKLIEELFGAPEGSEKVDHLEILTILVKDYESKLFKIDTQDPIEAIKFRLDQLHLNRADLEKDIGPRGRVSEILNRKRNLTLSMIRKLNKSLNIPAEILIQETKKY